jgi:hypothetical protein
MLCLWNHQQLERNYTMLKTQITDYLTYSQPFGPEDAALITDVFCRRRLFQAENGIYTRMRQSPTWIIGRKGSGKTAFLRSDVEGQDRVCVLDLNSASAFATIIRTVQSMGLNSLYVEPVAGLWRITFWLALFFESRSAQVGTYKREPVLKGDERGPVVKFLSAVDPAYEKHSAAEFLVTALTVYRNRAAAAGCQPETLGDFVNSLEVEGTSFGQTEKLLSTVFVERGLRAVLTIDSLDTRVDVQDRYDLVKDEANLAISGLIKCLGAFSQLHGFYDVRFCLPSERYYEYMSLSSNPAKDMVNQAILKWSAGELICVAAHRLGLFLRHHQDYGGYYDSHIARLESQKRIHARQILQGVLGRVVLNDHGQDEDTISYVMRHTQLLPRHLLTYLNAIFAVQKELGEAYLHIRGEAIKSGVARMVETVCHEIFAAYKHLYPRAEQVCTSCIPELCVRFKYGELHIVFNQQGKRTFDSEDFEAFRRMLIEMGVVGKVVGETERYVLGLFEYASPHRMAVGSSDELCLHPVFSAMFSGKCSQDGKVVYPYGSDANSDEQLDFHGA